MKTIKRLLCMAIAIMMLMSCVSMTATAKEGTAGVFSDVSGDQIYSNAVSTINLMGVIN